MPDNLRYTRFQDIPQLTRAGTYEVDVDWRYVEHTLDDWAKYPGGIDLDPDYQRAHVWTPDKQRRYVEWVLRGGTSALVVLFNCSTWNKGVDTPVELVDGKQRLEAVRRFMRNDMRIFGSTYAEFTDNMRMTKARFRFQVNDLPTRAEVLQWYIDINAGGVAHTPREIDRVRALLDEATNPRYK